MLYFKESVFCVSLLFIIAITSFFVILDQEQFSPFNGVFSLFLCACIMFSFAVAHSKLYTLLSVFIPFIWFTCGLFSGFGINASHTILCTLNLFIFLFLYKLTCKYPFLQIKSFVYSELKVLLYKDLILPRLLTKYNPSYPFTLFQTSKFIKIKYPSFKKVVVFYPDGISINIFNCSDHSTNANIIKKLICQNIIA